MVWPLVIGAAVAIGGAVSQYLSSEEGRRASAEERAKLEALLKKVSVPKPDASAITPEEYKIAARYVPDVAPYIAESNPTLVKADSAGAKLGRSAQEQALRALMAKGNAAGPDEESRLLTQQALSEADTANRGRLGAITEDFAHRGMGGGPMELAAQLSNAQAANSAASSGARASALEAIRGRLQALQSGAQLGGQIRQEDVELERGNNSILNDFSQRLAAQQNAYQQQVSAARNDAARFNTTNAQDIANRNTQGHNAAAVANRDRANQAGQTGFENEMQKVGVQGGVANMARADATNTARDRNAAISGAGEGAMTALAYGGAQPTQKAPAQASFAEPEANPYPNDPAYTDDEMARRKNRVNPLQRNY